MTKMVRDRIPELYPQHRYRKATPLERGLYIRMKLVEEVGEVLSAPDTQSLKEELADVLAVIAALRNEYGWTAADLARMETGKAADRGRFNEGWILETDEPMG